jgi:thiol-disulfide isomerase/thioredoxin
MRKLLFMLTFAAVITLFDTIDAKAGKNIEVFNFNEFSHWLNKQNDTIYVINFWATWCAPCIKEIPDFEKLQAQYKDKKVKVLFVSLDFPNQVESRVIPFINRMNMQSQVVMLNDTNSNRWIPLVDESWSGAIPATLIYNKNFRKFYEREFTFNELEAIVVQLIK